MLRENHFGYLKVDYNDEIGPGADGCESPGEKLRRQMLESYRYFEHISEELPGIIIENCASGGHRLEPGYMKRTSMASFSDAHECVEIPMIAANLHRCILPQQSQIWAVMRRTDSLKRTAWSVISTFLGRMCVSGDVLDLSDEQWRIIEEGIAFYRKIVPVLRNGCSFRFGTKVRSMRHPEGWQALLRVTDREGYVVWNTYAYAGKAESSPEIRIPQCGRWEIAEVFSHAPQSFRQEGDAIIWEDPEDYTAFAMRLKKIIPD